MGKYANTGYITPSTLYPYIDDQIENKFNAFKDYAAQQGIQWGFVRDKDNQLYINNTEFSIDMADDAWQPLENIF